jgi:hypothetical protein
MYILEFFIACTILNTQFMFYANYVKPNCPLPPVSVSTTRMLWEIKQNPNMFRMVQVAFRFYHFHHSTYDVPHAHKSILLLCWGKLAFTKVLTIYQVYHTWIHSLHHSPLPPSPIPGTVSTGLILHLHTCILSIALYSISYTLSLYPPPPLVPTPQSRPVMASCSLILLQF